MNDIKQQHAALKQDIERLRDNEILFRRIAQWEKESIRKIQSNADQARKDLEKLIEQSKMRSQILIKRLSTEFQKSQHDTLTIQNINQWKTQLDDLKKSLDISSEIELTEDDASSIQFRMTKAEHQTRRDVVHSSPQTEVVTNDTVPKTNGSASLRQRERDATGKTRLSVKEQVIPSDMSYLCLEFGLTHCSDQKLKNLFEHIMRLKPMDKNGPMSGKCEIETAQMERFLTDTFGFQNIRGEYIVQGVKSFRLRTPLNTLDPNTIIHFPDASRSAFTMAVKEIIQWQQSYRVYAYKDLKGMTNDFLQRALQGFSADGEEAFLMKYAVRISTCPILMEFDAEVISRELNEDWPNRIKLVSVTGIDFAGRKHDVNDILNYLSNWKDVYDVDHTGKKPALANERDFRRRKNGAFGILYQDHLLNSLKDMARLRLLACDEEGVQIVVETGIGLGVFSGERIGISEQVQITSALAIRSVLEEDGLHYKNIRAIIFALPIIDPDHNEGAHNPFNVFAEQFQEPMYKGRIPVLIADQDMHRLTVAIARCGFTVSQLNPADSHGVFGEYWQNRGPAVEEKLALTTLGLLVQHHLINPNVLDSRNYKIFPYPKRS